MKNFKNYNFFILLILLGIWILPLIQNNFELLKSEKLDGVSIEKGKDTSLSYASWFSGSYSELKEKHINDNFGFREFAIRTQNQIQYTIFGKANANDVIVGKNNYLYEYKYIKAYFGDDYIGMNEIKDKVSKMKFLQDTLKKLNKTFLVLLAPSKASFFSEYIPNRLKKPKERSNYDDFAVAFRDSKINLIDYSLMYRRLKSVCKFPLYPVGGTHWTEYGGYIAFDSLKNYINNNTKFSLPEMDYSEIRMSDAYIGADNDIGKAINLLFPPYYGELAYPELKIKESISDRKPNVLVVSDSYWMRMYYTPLPQKMFATHSFWYYNNFIYDYNHETEGKKTYELDLQAEIMKKDVIAIMCTEPNLKAIGWGFVEDLYQLYKVGNFDGYDRKRNLQLLLKKLNLIDDAEALDKIKRIAKRENRPIDSVACNMAKYLVDLEAQH